ncbi:MAG TPA: Asp-tRNA(Asn)/Glu-tRNA(Gln) amidotransferase subunit GatB [Candidatus Acidoferrales bacterium]|nr:Asp-tRNA(Asn)/Glu-tRNA(Gln) amidotransferase subunit GatB [Candidatus Acidoferrales bacterium]
MASENWRAVIGMEVHVQLATQSKMFCACPTDYLEQPPNQNTCPTCLGLPGALPVANRRAVELVVKSGLALGCQIAQQTKFDRKNYFYPDLPKGYQISQYDLPIASGGGVQVGERMVRITRVHLEEDTGKLAHAGDNLQGASESLVDLNRAGLPLMEIVSEPDLDSADQARDYAVELRAILRTIGASEAEMENGQLRVEANVSVRRSEDAALGVKTELKNINSFRSLHRAIGHEIERQIGLLEAGGVVIQETRGWSEAKSQTYSQRSKEFAEDYRYFPEPDLPPLELAPAWVAEIAATIPELPRARRLRLMESHQLGDYDAGLLVQDGARADLFEAALALGAPAKPLANWIVGHAPKLPAPDLAELVILVSEGRINREQALVVMARAESSGQSPAQIVAESNLAQVSDDADLAVLIDQVLVLLPQAVADYRAGKAQALGALMAGIKSASQGRANMKAASRLLAERLQR